MKASEEPVPTGSQSAHSSCEADQHPWSEGAQEDGCAMNQKKGHLPAAVANEPKQAGEAQNRKWRWAEPVVWTKRMLAALERGVKGGKWFALIDKIYDPRALQSAFASVKRNDGAAGSDGQSVKQFGAKKEEEILRLSEELRAQSYHPRAVKRVWIEKPGSKDKRPLGIPAVRDRVVQMSVRQAIEPIFESEFLPQSYGFRPGRGCKDALRRVKELLKAGHHHVVDADLKSCFDSIPHEGLMERVSEKISDGRVLALVESFLKAGVLNELREWEPSLSGTPQGAVISPLLANIYLHPLDLLMQQSGVEMVRYADDFVLLCRTEEEAQVALERVRAWTQAEGLQLHPEKTRVVDMTQPKAGFDFLGYHFYHGGKRWPRKKSKVKLRHKLRPLTKRTSGESLSAIIQKINPILRGWHGYFRHVTGRALVDIDGWVRGRLRSILKRREGRRGQARQVDNERWPNAYFDRNHLFSLHGEWRRQVQSGR